MELIYSKDSGFYLPSGAKTAGGIRFPQAFKGPKSPGHAGLRKPKVLTNGKNPTDRLIF